MTSHREAPSILNDPAADNTDVYAFVSPDAPKTVTFISNFIPGQGPAGGPNFYKFADDVLYEIMIDNNGDGVEDVTYQFKFTSEYLYPTSFLYNVGPITFNPTSDYYENINFSQRYSVTKVTGPRRTGTSQVVAFGMKVPPVNIGPRSTPNYDTALVPSAIYSFPDGIKTFAGQRADGFYVDLGSIFDLGALRPFENLHLIPTPAAPGVDTLQGLNVNSIAIQVPIQDVTSNGSIPTSVSDPAATIGVWSSASRQKASVLQGGPNGTTQESGTVDSGLPTRQPAHQRSDDTGGHEGLLEPAEPSGRLAVPGQLPETRSAGSDPCAVSERLPQPRRLLRIEQRRGQTWSPYS